MDLEELKPGDVFRLANQPAINPNRDPFRGFFEYYGHGWYGRPYSGNALCSPERRRREVIPATTEEQMTYNHQVLNLHQKRRVPR